MPFHSYRVILKWILERKGALTMSHENNEQLNSNLDELVFHTAIKDGLMGAGIWNMTANTFDIMEKITGYPSDYFHSLPDFIDKIALEKDRQLAHSDIKSYLNGKQTTFNSTFRIETKNHQYKWLLIKGKVIHEAVSGDKNFQLMFHDVTGKNYLTGNDEETNLLNRKYFIRKLRRVNDETESNQPAALIGINLINLQSLLYVHGYQVGNELINRTTNLLNQVLGQESDIAYYSKDYYLALIYDVDSLESTLAELIQTFKKPISLNDQMLTIEINLGVTLIPEHSENAMELLQFVDKSLYQAKELGKYHTIYFNKDLSETIYNEHLIKTELISGLKNNEFYLLYQPQVDIKTRTVIGLEALSRWKNDKLGMVAPSVFIPVAEKHGDIIELGRFILEESIQTASKWLKSGYNFGTMSINISPVELSKPGYVNHIIELCETYQVPKDCLKLEITEGVYVESMKNSLETVRELVESGFHISVDDFGTSYSNLAFLSKAKIDTLKIDKSLVDALYNDSGKKIVETIVNLGRDLECKVLAEGVETEEQLHILEELGCQLIQGYYFSKPKTYGEMETFFKTGNKL